MEVMTSGEEDVIVIVDVLVEYLVVLTVSMVV